MPRTSHLLAPISAGTASGGPPILSIAPPALLSPSLEGSLEAICNHSLPLPPRSTYIFEYHLNPSPNSIFLQYIRTSYRFRTEPSSLYLLSYLIFTCRTEKTEGGGRGMLYFPVVRCSPKSERPQPHTKSRFTSHAPLSPFPATLTEITPGDEAPYSQTSLCRRITALLRFHWKQGALAWIMPSTPREGAPIRGYT
jgi:hypothetical protein